MSYTAPQSCLRDPLNTAISTTSLGRCPCPSLSLHPLSAMLSAFLVPLQEEGLRAKTQAEARTALDFTASVPRTSAGLH